MQAFDYRIKINPRITSVRKPAAKLSFKQDTSCKRSEIADPSTERFEA
jgi:hypothetical protein